MNTIRELDAAIKMLEKLLADHSHNSHSDFLADIARAIGALLTIRRYL